MTWRQLTERGCRAVVGNKYLLSGIKGSSKTNMPSSKYWWPWNSPVAILCQIYDQTQFHMVKFKALIMPLTIWNCLISRVVISVKIGLSRNYFHMFIMSHSGIIPSQLPPPPPCPPPPPTHSPQYMAYLLIHRYVGVWYHSPHPTPSKKYI